jgi:hypothetical protein
MYNNYQPKGIRDIVKLNMPSLALCFGGRKLLEMLDIRSANDGRSFLFGAPSIWNSLLRILGQEAFPLSGGGSNLLSSLPNLQN